jgi:hypothetical protein
VEDDQMTTRVIDTDARDEEREDDERWIDSESGGRGGWDDDGDDEAIPPRPRGRLLRPLPLALIALIVAAAGFLGGVEAQKGSESGSGATAARGGGLPNFAALKEAGSGAGSESKGSESSVPSFGGSSAAATGTVTSVEGNTIYVKESDGTTVAVKVGDGATVTRDSNVAAKKIHPGDTVTVEGSKNGSTVRASSVSATESGVESTAGFGSAAAGGGEAGTSVESLFEE